MKSISDIQHTFYINLAQSPDRNQHVESQLTSLGITDFQRFNAIKLANGALGCSMSHLKCLEIAKAASWPHIMIVEDDIQFLNPEFFKSQLSNFLSTHESWDVILVGGNNMPPFKPIDRTCIKVTRCQTTTGYIVQNHYFDTLIANYREGIKKLMGSPDKHSLYAIDKYWFSLQEKDKWYLIIPLSVTQREDYSDIEKRPTNYAPAMLDIDKIALMKSQIKKKQEQEQSKPKLKLFNLPH